jgi:3-hydroxyacyl-[acyl-carrier-protein] dehydratase
MQFTLIDRILELEPGRRVVAIKNLTLAEEYLAEHFPGFPVLPGVLMLEAAVQASAWLVRITEDYAHSMVVLKSVRAVKYGNFVVPGKSLTIQADIVRHEESETELKCKGTVDGINSVSGRIVLERYNLRDREQSAHGSDRELVRCLKAQFPLLARDWIEAARRRGDYPAETGTVVAV